MQKFFLFFLLLIALSCSALQTMPFKKKKSKTHSVSKIDTPNVYHEPMILKKKKKIDISEEICPWNDYRETELTGDLEWINAISKCANPDSLQKIKDRMELEKDSKAWEPILNRIISLKFQNKYQFFEAGEDGSTHRIINPENYPFGNKRVIFYNGIRTFFYEAKEIAENISKRLKHPVDLIHFQTGGFHEDIEKIRDEHVGKKQRSSKLFEIVCRRAISEGADHIYVFGHSGARAGIYNTVKTLPFDWRNKFTLIMFGGAGVLPKTLASRVVNYRSENDHIALYVTSKYFPFDALKGKAEVIILQNKRFINKFLDHAMANPTYQEALKKELREIAPLFNNY